MAQTLTNDADNTTAQITGVDSSILNIVLMDMGSLRPHPNNPRKHNRKQIGAIAESIRAFRYLVPVVIDRSNQIISGNGRYEAAKLLQLKTVPTVQATHLSDEQARAFMLADNKLAERSSWDDVKLAGELKELSALAIDFDITLTGFEMPEIDIRIQSLDDDDVDTHDDFEPPVSAETVAKAGDLFLLGNQKILCGDALDSQSYALLLGDSRAAAVFTDPPYNVPINGHVRTKSNSNFAEFAMASGEMSDDAFGEFLDVSLRHCSDWTKPGGIAYVCMDWRHIHQLRAAGLKNQFKPLNLCVWVKPNGGMGSFYRSQHEMVFVFANKSGNHTNNIQLGRFGRYRTNVWNYAGAGGFKRTRGTDDFDSHPTVKPIRLIMDALADATSRDDIVLDPFLGSGSTLLAAEKSERRCYGIEIDQHHVDTTIQRWQKLTGSKARHISGVLYDDLQVDRTASQDQIVGHDA